ncbi:hypothetical protein [Caballeronia cordobensis]|uniref:hypothetical protein n=1 Tax=Caballeronia cordobensis TaxID=1353886 RepID=UPI00045EECE8|nr:uncharacterized protein BRPE67_ECDS01260 [Burkholderia sp. RPE67]
MHIAQLTEGAGIVLCALFLDINASAICAIAALIVLHELTVSADLRYASTARVIVSVEQMVHSVLEMAPVMGFAIVRLARRKAFVSLVNGGGRLVLALREPPMSAATAAAVAGLVRRVRGRAVRHRTRGACIRASRKRATMPATANR